jgi:2-polyprenyl-6-hydroxyphenyl methylase/3-demethylubiquinone-9 3-methyltransferase
VAPRERESFVSADRAESTGADSRLTTRAYWDHSWRGASAGQRRVKRLRRLEALDWQFGQMLLRSADRARPVSGRLRVLEIGCANTIWLPFLAREAHAEVVGVDYSERGCDLARQNLAAERCAGTIVCADFFEYLRSSPAAFDLVMSFGLIEHFEQVAEVLRSMAEIVRPGGLLVATVPNLGGLYGRMQALVDAEVLKQHLVLGADALADHARTAGLTDLETGYVGGAPRLSALNFSHLSWLPSAAVRLLSQSGFMIDYAVSQPLRLLGRPHGGPFLAPYAYLVGRAAEGGRHG